ncbi:hypothetical protein GPA10_32465 [Streptomyces sp. p1417]|uniref:Uncharacterized protein n=1 Tax=Streptomyces typhae TaxID=2681492 RepID=A0A6L6X6B9_9ACTN|nr:hypothetical protein [Streptomyces typhae]MVO89342.1 hypothetical protein [Streptomyces typhae]
MRIAEVVAGAVGTVVALGALGTAAAPAAAADEPSRKGLGITSIIAKDSFDGVPGKELVEGLDDRS